jgi:integrase
MGRAAGYQGKADCAAARVKSRMNRLEEVPSADVLPQLHQQYEHWIGGLEISREYRASIASTFKALLQLRSTPTIGDLPDLLRLYRGVCKGKGTSVMFTRSRAIVQGFVRDTLGRHHALYLAVAAIPSLSNALSPKRRAQRPEALAELLAKLPEPHRSMAWSMAVTGMGPKEYWGAWERRTGPARVHVDGTKRQGRVRDVPQWAEGLPIVPVRSRSRFVAVWKDHLVPELGIYDLRRSFAVWMEDSGIPRSRQKLYMGHSVGDITGLYQTRDLLAWLGEDAERLVEHASKAVPYTDIHPDTAGPKVELHVVAA